jgi:hypothetical protein
VITSVRQAAAACNVTPPVVRRWLTLGLIPEPPWTRQQLQQVRDKTDPQGRRRGPDVPHGTLTRWLEGCATETDAVKPRTTRLGHADEPGRRSGYLPRCGKRLLDAMYSGQPFRAVLRDLGLTSNQVWGLTRTDDDWSAALEATLTATRRDDLQHGTSAAYAHGCVCSECRAH